MSIMKPNIIEKSLSVKLAQGLLLVATVFSVQADDTEVFFTESSVNSNVLFVMDNSGSMTAPVAGSIVDPNNPAIITASSVISNSNDDAEQNTGGDRIPSRDSSDLEMPRDDGDKQVVGLRFTNVNVPQGAKITSAFIQFTADVDTADLSSVNTKLIIKIQNNKNPGKFKEVENDITSRTLVGKKVVWHPVPWMIESEQGDAQKTPDLKVLVQKVINKGGWKKNNAIVFLVKGNKGKRSAQSFDDNPDGAPVLIISYESTSTEKSRLQVMQSALKTVLAGAPSNLSVGIMNYGNTTKKNRKDRPNGVSFPVTSVNMKARPIVEEAITINGVIRWDLSKTPEPDPSATVRQYLSEIADSWEAKGRTPIVDALYEASLYYRGEPSRFGANNADKLFAAHPTTYAHPAPDLVEPVQDIFTLSACTGSGDDSKYHYEVWGDADVAYWESGQTWDGLKCPADRDNPTNPGTVANCANTKHDCRIEVDSVCHGVETQVETGTTCGPVDEDGNQDCETDYDYQCDVGYVDENVRVCYFSVCQVEKTKKPMPDYISPAVADCQSNNIVLMSDGKPETLKKNGDEAFPKALVAIQDYMGLGSAGCVEEPNGFKSGRCGSELTAYLSDNDINSGLVGDQTIDTHVIGFADGISAEAIDYLKSLVTIDDPTTPNKVEGYFSAQDEAELAQAFADTLESIAQEARSQASPGYSVNVKSGLEHEDDIYIPVFDKSRGSTWAGNLKLFKLVDDNGHRFIKGKDGGGGYKNAMTELGLFKDDAWDIWSQSQTPDGNSIHKGGTASLLDDPRQRKLYSNIFSNNIIDSKNRIKRQNPRLREDMLFDRNQLGLSVQEAKKYRKTVINYIRGWIGGNDGGWGDGIGNGFPEGNIPAQSRKHMGDMLHAEPVVITYGAGKQYIFAATNEGFLHVFDTTTGEEKFAFMPKELLKNIEPQFSGEGAHLYGIDGNISYFIHNKDDNDAEISGNEKLMLYFGLRRGGSSYYALDITDIDKPTIEWTIDEDTGGFSDLGQSWSMPYIANVYHNGSKKPAVIFTGGYDTAQDYYGNDEPPVSVTGNANISKGKDIYIVDALGSGGTTDLWWKMSSDAQNGADVSHSIPGGVRILDVNRNGLLDRLYFADTGGNVWRLDLKEDLSSGSVLNKIASLGGGGSDSRKFYNEPDVAMMRGNGKLMFTVSVGSGLRAHPLNEDIDDHMFILLDKNPIQKMPEPFSGLITKSDLAQVAIAGAGDNKSVTVHFGAGNEKITDTDLDGWYVTLPESGEKVLASSITFEGSLLFTTLVPKVLVTGDMISLCASPTTQGRIYAMNILTGKASFDLDGNDAVNDQDVFETISASEIPGTPQLIFNALVKKGGGTSGDPETYEHPVDIRIGKKSTEVGVRDTANVESIYWSDPAEK